VDILFVSDPQGTQKATGLRQLKNRILVLPWDGEGVGLLPRLKIKFGSFPRLLVKMTEQITGPLTSEVSDET